MAKVTKREGSRPVGKLSMPRRYRRLMVCSAALGIAGYLSPETARAGTNGTWTNLTSGGLWSVGTNWSGGTIADGQDGIADFSTLNITADNTVHLDTARTIGSLLFADATTASNNWILDNNALASNVLTLSTSAGVPSISVTNQTTTISAVLAGTQGFTKSGAGILALSGANTFTGAVTLSAGTLNINNDAALGAVPGVATTDLTFSASSTLVASGALVNLNANRNISIGTSTTATIDTGTNMLVINGGITNTTASTSISKASNAGILVLAGSNNFVAGTTILFAGNATGLDDGIIRLANSNALGSNAVTIDAGTAGNLGNQAVATIELSGGITLGSGDTVTSRGKNSGDAFFRSISGNNTWAGNVQISSTGGQMSLESADPNSTFTLSGSISAAANVTNRTALLFGNGNGSVSAPITNGAGTSTLQVLVVGGRASSTWTFSGANTYTGTTPALNVNGGTALVDYNAGGSFASTTNLLLTGGTLSMKGKTAGTTAQTFAGTFTIGGSATGQGAIGGGGVIKIDPNGGTSTTLTLPNTWTRNAGGAVHFDLSAGTSTTAIVSTNPTVTNSIFGYGTVNDGSGIGFLTISSSKVARYTGATALPTSGTTSTTNYSVTLAGTTQTQTTASFALNSLGIDASGGGTLDLGGATDIMTLTSGGLLMTNATATGNFTIQNGQVGNTSQELIVQQYGSGTLTINGTISGGTGSLTKAGPGTLVVGSANTYTGATNIAGGVVSIGADNLGTTAAAIIFNGGTLAVTNSFTLATTHNITVDSSGASIDVPSGLNLTYGGVMASPTNGVGGGTGLTGGALTKLNTGTLTLTGTSNTYAGGTFLQAGTLAINGDGSLGVLPGSVQSPGIPDVNVIFSGNSTLQANAATVSLIANRTVLIDTGVTATLDAQANSLSVAGAITSQSGSGAISVGVSGGSSSGLVTFSSATSSHTLPITINAGTLAVSFLSNGGNMSSLGASTNTASNLIFNGGGLRYTGATTSTDRNFTINTGKTATIDVSTTATILTMSGVTPATNGALTKAGAGTLSLTGAQIYTGNTTITAGTLAVNGSLAAGSAVSVNNGGILGGTGTVNGSVTVNSGGTVAPGNSVGTLTVGSMTLSSGSLLSYEFSTLPSNDQVTVFNSGGLALNGGSFTLLSAGTANPFTTNGTYTLINYSGALGGSTGNLSVANVQPGKSYTFANIPGTAINLTIGDSSSGSWTNGSGNELWTNPANWLNSSIPNGASTTATFGSDLIGADGVVQLNGNKTVGSIAFNNAVSFNLSATNVGDTLTLDNGGGSSAINVTAGTHTISVPITLNSNPSITLSSGTSLTLAGAMTGASKSLSLTGSGTLILGGNNTYTTTTVNGGTLQVGNGSTTGTLGTSDVTLAAGTNLVFNRSNALTVSNNLIGGSATITQNGAGTTTVSALPSGIALAVNHGALDLNGNNATLRSLTGNVSPGDGIITDNSGTAGTTSITVSGAPSAVMDYYGSINKGATRDLSLTLNVTGANNKLTLHNASTYSGGTTLSQGLLDVVATGGLGTGPVNINPTSAPTRLEVGDGVTIGNNITISAQNAGVGLGSIQSITTAQTTTFTGTITLGYVNNTGSGGQIVGPTAGGNLIFSGPIVTSTGSNLLVRAGNVQFADSTGTSNYPLIGITGSGKVTLGHDDGISTIAVANMGINGTAGTLDLNGFNQTLGGLTQTTAASVVTNSVGDGTASIADNKTLTLNTAADSTYAGTITASISVVKSGSAVQTLSAASNIYDGSTTISGGTLAVPALTSGGVADSIGFNGNVTLFGSSSLVFDGGALRYTGATASTDRNFDITAGKTATIDVSTAATNLTWTGGANAGTGSFAKAGAGTLTLTGTHAYTGNTTVSAGTLLVGGTITGGGATSVATGATLLVNGTISNGSSLSVASGAVLGGTGSVAGALNHTTGTITGATVGTIGTLTLTGPLTTNGGTVLYDIAGSATPAGDLINDSGNFTFGATPGIIDMEFTNTGLLPASFSYKLFGYTGSLSGTPNFSYTSNLGRATFTTVTTNPNEIDVNVVTGGIANLNWNSTSDANWDVNTTANWYNVGNNVTDKYFQGDNVNFVDNNSHSTPPNGQLQTAITLNTTVTPSSVNLTANSNSYSISGTGKISGTATLSVSGTATLTLQTNNDYTGTTTISSGTLNVGGSGTTGSLGSGTVAITSPGTLLYSRSDSTTVTNTVTGNGNYTIAGTTAITVLNGDDSGFTGALTIQSGLMRPANVNTFGSGGATVLNGGEIYWDTGSNHTVTTVVPLVLNGTGSGAAGANNDGAVRVGSAAVTTWPGTVTIASNALIGMDGGATFAMTNSNAITGTNTTLSLTGGGTLSIGGNVNLGATGALATGTSPVVFAPPGSSNINVSSPITGGGAVTFNTGGTPAQGALGSTTPIDNPAYTGNITVGSGNLILVTPGELGTTAGGTTIVGSGAAATVVGILQLAPTSAGITVSEPLTVGARMGGGLDVPHIENVSGANTINGTIATIVGGSDYNFQVDAGTLAISSNITSAGLPSGRNLKLQGAAGAGTWSGVISDNATAPLTLVKNGAGDWTLSGVNSYTGNTNVNAGTLTIATGGAVASTTLTVASGAVMNVNGSLVTTATVNDNGTTNFGGNTGATPLIRQIAALNVGAAAVAKVLASTTPNIPTVLDPALTFGAGGTLDLTNNELIATAASPASIRGLLQTGTIFTSNPGLVVGGTLGYIDAGGGNTEVRFTLLGDSDVNGKVDVNDLGNLATNYGAVSGDIWVQGDFDYNGTVDVSDLGDLASGYGSSIGGGYSTDAGPALAQELAAAAASPMFGAAAAVPEPTSLGLVGLAMAALLPRRRRHDR